MKADDLMSWDQFKSDWLKMNVLTKTGTSYTKNLVVIESKGWYIIHGEPFSFFSISACLHGGEFYQCIMRYRDNSFARVTFDIAERADLLEIFDSKLKASLLL